MREVICETCNLPMKEKKGKIKIQKSQTIPTSGACSPTTSIPHDYTASRFGGAQPERQVLHCVTYVCEKCKKEKIIEL